MSAVKTVLVTVLAGTLSIGIAVLGERWFGEEGGRRPPPADGGLLHSLPQRQWVALDGRTLESADWAGRAVLLHYWASWCEVCRQQLDLVAEIHAREDAAALQVVGIAIDRREDLEAFLAERPLDYPVVLGDAAAVADARRLGNHLQGLPFLVLFDAGGQRLFERTGALSGAALARQVERALASGAGAPGVGGRGPAWDVLGR